MIRSLLVLLFWVVTVPLGALVAFPWTFITGRPEFLFNVGIALLRGGMRVAGMRVHVVGLQKLEVGRTYIFMSNHVSNLDPPLLMPAIPGRTSVLVKKELFRIPILGRAMLMVSLVPVDRSDREAAFASLRSAGDVLRSGIHLTTFPEGTRSPDGRLLPLKKGPFHVATETGVPIVPVTLLGTFEAMPKGRLAIRPGKVTIVFHEPIDPASFPNREDLIKAVRTSIESALPQNRRDAETQRKSG